MLSTEALASLRTLSNRALPDTCVIQRVTQTADGSGGQTDAWATASTVACRVSPLGQQNPSEAVIAERIQGAVPFTVTLPSDVDITERDRIAVNGQTLQVRGVIAPRSWQTSVKAVCERIG